MQVYTVRLTASHESSKYIGYHQAYDAYSQSGEWCGGVGKDASCFAYPSQVEGTESPRVILERSVLAPTPYSACRKLEEWIGSGKPDSFLTEEQKQWLSRSAKSKH